MDRSREANDDVRVESAVPSMSGHQSAPMGGPFGARKGHSARFSAMA
jgi:hypothetical protein